MSKSLPAQLIQRCEAIDDDAEQGVPLPASDYLWFAVVTAIVPAILICVGGSL